MITIRAKTLSDAWAQAMPELLERGAEEKLNGFYRNDSAAIEVESVTENLFHPLFPMDEEVIKAITEHLTHGKGVAPHTWTRLYRQRLFGVGGSTNYIDKIVSLLREWSHCPRAQVTAWNNDLDHERDSHAPCLQVLWFKILANSLHLHVHMRTCDCYGKLLMNMHEFVGVQKLVASKLGIEPARYTHFIDSLHVHERDTEAAQGVCEALQS